VRGKIFFSRRARTAEVTLLILTGLVSAGLAYALDVPPLTGRIVDTARLLSMELLASLSEELAAHERRTGNQIAVLTVPSLEGEPLEGFSHRVASTWKLGQKGTDNGVLLLVAPQDRRVRIEVGYGLEGVLTDAMTSRIIRNEIVPRFRTGDYGQGIESGVTAILRTIEGTYVPTSNDRDSSSGREVGRWGGLLPAVLVGAVVGAILVGLTRTLGVLGGGLLAFLLALSSGIFLAIVAGIVALVLGLVLSALFRGGGSIPGGYIGGWSGRGMGDFSGGDSFIGGGGGFGGGGASGRW
jgi:uncharacterized protein